MLVEYHQRISSLGASATAFVARIRSLLYMLDEKGRPIPSITLRDHMGLRAPRGKWYVALYFTYTDLNQPRYKSRVVRVDCPRALAAVMMIPTGNNLPVIWICNSFVGPLSEEDSGRVRLVWKDKKLSQKRYSMAAEFAAEYGVECHMDVPHVKSFPAVPIVTRPPDLF